MADEPPGISALTAKRLLLQARKLDLQLQIMKGQRLSRDTVRQVGAQIGAEIRKDLSRFHLLAPSLVGQRTQEADRIIRDFESDILERCHQMIERLENLTDTDRLASNLDEAVAGGSFAGEKVGPNLNEASMY